MLGTVNFDFKPYKYIVNLLQYILIALSIFLVIIVFGNVVGRYAFNFSFAWAEEASRFLFIWVVFIGAVLINEKYEHMNLDILVKLLPEKIGRIVQLIAQFIILVILGILIKGGITVTVENISWKSPALEIPYGYVYSIVPFSCLIMFFQTMVRIVLIGKQIRDNKPQSGRL